MAVSSESLNDGFKIFIGVDQTGAALDQGRCAKPLPAATLTFVKNKPRLRMTTRDRRPLGLASFNSNELERTLSLAGVGDPSRAVRSKTTALLVDCVFGLAETVWSRKSPPGLETLWKLFVRAARDEGPRKGYGLQSASLYFEKLLEEWAESIGLEEYQVEYPVRRCEAVANANSVFRTRPYQKNIQCGTYRIWRDLGERREPWLNIRYFTPASKASMDRPWIFEAYPTLLWRELFGLPIRRLADLPKSIKRLYPEIHMDSWDQELMSRDGDAADAAVLAIGGYILQSRRGLFTEAPSRAKWLAREGWIVGLPASPVVDKSKRDGLIEPAAFS